MALLKENSDKLYYSIGEVASMFEVSKSLIRYWEREFDFLRPHKNGKGDRRFTKQNIAQLQLIYDLVKVRGFTLQGAKREITLHKDRHQKRQEALQSLQKIRGFLEHLKNKL